MDGIWHAVAVSFGLGTVYFIAAIPAGMALGLHAGWAAAAAWAGYAGIAGAAVLLGAPAREWLARRFGWEVRRDPRRLFWRVWDSWGLPGMALLAPVTVGPYSAAFLALALGKQPGPVFAWIAIAAIPWCIGFAVAGAFGLYLFPG
jgi:hypothetical protein